MELFFWGFAIIAASGVLSFFLTEKFKGWLVAGGVLSGCIPVMISAMRSLLSGKSEAWEIAAGYPLGRVVCQIDPFGAFFLMVICVGTILGFLYLTGYIRTYLNGRRSITAHLIFLVIMVLSMLLLVTLHNVLAFLIVWEIMSLSSFFLIGLESEKEDVFTASLNYLVMMHISVVFLVVGFIMLVIMCNGMQDFDEISKAVSAFSVQKRDFVLMLLLTGFGIKAGMFPFHCWMPQAYPAAPNHVSALMSGVMSKMGIFGMLQSLALVGTPSVWVGYIVLALGGVSALVGIVYALVQTDVKRIVAYSSVENIGIIFMGVGCGILGCGYSNLTLVYCGFGGALFHVLNHSLFKGLLFHCTGVICRQMNSRSIECMGGLARRMPMTAGTAVVGGMAISALPPFNGFASEFLIYLGMLGGMSGGNTLLVTVMALAVMVLALTGALALICFTRFIGIVFLGHPRSEAAARAVEPPATMLIPMVIGAVGCLAAGIGAVPVFQIICIVVQGISSVPSVMRSIEPVSALQSLCGILYVSAILLLAIGVLLTLRWLLLCRREVSERDTWGCGYDRPSARIQYTGFSFSLPLLRIVGKLFKNEMTDGQVKGMFPVSGRFEYKPGDFFQHYLVAPVVWAVRSFMERFTWIQNGNLQYYILYGIVFLMAVIVWVFIW